MENIKTDQPYKKLDQWYAKFTVREVCGSYTYRLDVPPGVHNVFPTWLLHPASENPLPGQIIKEPQPPGMPTDSNTEYEVKEILDEKPGRGRNALKQYLVKWSGYIRPTWEPHNFVTDLVTLNRWEERKQSSYVPAGGRGGRIRQRREERGEGG
jgi:hypothetical protein